MVNLAPHRICVAPMMDWSDRHYRYFMRQLAAEARVYTEMITTGALIHGDVDRHLAFSVEEHPVALQLGGSEPEELVHGARLGARFGSLGGGTTETLRNLVGRKVVEHMDLATGVHILNFLLFFVVLAAFLFRPIEGASAASPAGRSGSQRK
jgi:hypothetical protein